MPTLSETNSGPRTPSLDDVHEDSTVNTIESKFEVIQQSSSGDTVTYVGKYPLQPFRKGTRGTYGGDLVTQGVLAAWESIPDPEFSPHSLHAYFVRAGNPDIPVTWEVTKVTDGRNYANRLVKGIQLGKIMFTLQVSFARKNSAAERIDTGKPQLDFSTKPLYLLAKYRDRLHTLPFLAHTHNLLHHRIPHETLNGSGVIGTVGVIPEQLNYETSGNRTLGFFIKLNDPLPNAKNPSRAKVLQLCFALDATYLGTMAASLGVDINHLPNVGKTLDYFRVSLDHAVYFHDVDFTTDDYLYMEYRFPRFSNDRVLCYVLVYTLLGKLVCTVVQEALAYIDEPLKKRLDGLQGKL